MISGTDIAIEEPCAELLEFIGEGLRSHNIQHGNAPAKPVEFVVTLRSADGELLGGILCDLYLGGLHIEWVWIRPDCRGACDGRRLMEAAEREGRARGARFAHLDTFSFQARGFYDRCGYAQFGQLDYPDSVKRYYLQKAL